MSEVLQVTGLKKRYGGFQLDIPDFHVEAGTVTGLVGRQRRRQIHHHQTHSRPHPP